MKFKKILSTAVVLTGTWLTGTAQYQGDPTLMGYQYSVIENLFTTGLYELPTTGTTASLLWEDSYAYQGEYASGIEMTSGWIRNGQMCGYVACYPFPSQAYYKYVERDLVTGVVNKEMDVDISSGWTNYFLNAAYCSADDRIYGYGFNDTRTAFAFKSAPANNPNQGYVIKNVGSTYPGSICYNPELGIFVGVLNTKSGDYYTNSLVQIDVNTGQTTELFTIQSEYLSDYKCTGGLIWVPSRQAYLWNFYNAGQEEDFYSVLMELDPVKKKSTVIRTFDGNMNFMYFVAENNDPIAVSDAPAVVTDVKTVSDQTGFDLSFTLPATLVDGSAISGAVNYTIYVDNQVMQSGSDNAGAVVNTRITAGEGSHFIRIVPSVAGKSGIGEIYSAFVGDGTPETPENIVLTETELTWNPVTQGIVGNPLSGVTYHVYVNTVEIGETSETSMSMSGIVLPDGDLTNYQAIVTAEANGRESKFGYSNAIIVGKPWSAPFNIEPTEEQFSLMYQDDVDKDNVKWEFDFDSNVGMDVLTSGFARNEASDDWIFMPKFTADPNKVYTFAFDVYLADSTLPGGIVEAWLGDAPSKSAMTFEIVPAISLTKDNSWVRYSGEFVANGDLTGKELYLGIGVSSEEGILSPLRFVDLSVTESTKASIDGPEAVGNLTITRDEKDASLACLNFTMPDKTIAGTSIPTTATITVTITSQGASTETVTGNPGEAMTVKMQTAAGNNLIVLTPSYNDVIGLSKNCVSTMGLSTPGKVTNLRASYNETNTRLRIDWDAPTTDINGKPLTGDNFSYTVWTLNPDTGDFEYAVDVPYPLHFATMDMSESTTLTNLEVAITAANAMGDSPVSALILCQVGTPLNLPISDDFNGDTFKVNPLTYYVNDPYNNAAIGWGNPANDSWLLTGDMLSVEGDVLCGIPSKNGALTRIDLPKVSTSGYNNVSLQLNIWTGADAAKTTIRGTYPSPEPIIWNFASYYPTLEKEIATVPSGTGYELVTIDFPIEFLDQPWISTIIESEYPTLSSRFILAGYALTASSGITDVARTLAGTIIGREGVITVTGYDAETVWVYGLDGTLVATSTVDGNVCDIPVSHGMYIVKVADRAAKVIVK